MRHPWTSLAIYRRVLINLKTGRAVRGVLVAERRGLLELRDAELIEGPDARVTKLDGSTFVERSNIDFAQALPPEV